MGGIDTRRIHHADGVLSHSLHRDLRTGGLALPHPAIVESEAAKIGFQNLRPGQPAVAVQTDALNKYHGIRAGSFNFPRQ